MAPFVGAVMVTVGWRLFTVTDTAFDTAVAVAWLPDMSVATAVKV